MTATRTLLLVGLTFLLFIGVPAFAAVPATQPSAKIAAAYVALDDRDPLRRYEARAELMGLSRDELTVLLEVVRSNQPMAPAQAMVLRDIVIQAWMATEPFESIPAQGFLGLSGLRGADSGAAVLDPEDPAAGPGGVTFEARTPGFCAYRWLQDGDVILSFGTTKPQRVLNFSTLTTLVRDTPAGTTVQLRVLRGGGVVRLTFPLDARPVAAREAADATINLFRDAMRERMSRAEAYWQTNFAPLMDPDFT